MSKKVKSQSAIEPNWHPNFRDYESLPDIKAVRTSFFTSAVFVTLAVMAAMFMGFRYYGIVQLESNIKELERKNFSFQAQNNMALNKNKQFRDTYRKLQEVDRFVENQLTGSELIIALGEGLDDQMALTSLEYQTEMITIQGEIVGDRAEVTSVVDRYVAALQSKNADQGLFAEYDLVSLNAGKGGGLMTFTIVMSNPEDSQKGKKK